MSKPRIRREPGYPDIIYLQAGRESSQLLHSRTVEWNV